MVRTALSVIILAVMVGVAGTLHILPVGAQQQTPTVTRSISPSSVAAGDEVTVTIDAANYGPAGSIVENYPSGFAWVSSTHPGNQVQRSGEQVTFTLFGETSFSYTLMASSAAGSHTFSGTLTDGNAPPGTHTVTGASRVTVQAGPQVTASRSISPSRVDPSGNVTVTIRAANYGPAGSIAENYPAGFTWVSSTHPDGQIERSGDQVTFTLFGESSFSYTLTASDTAGSYTFSGTLTDGNAPPGTHTVTGASTVTVRDPAQPPPDLPPPPPRPTDRPGMVTLSDDMPMVGDALTATLADADGGIAGTTWQWSRCEDAAGSDCAGIANPGSAGDTLTSSSYTPVEADAGKYLEAKAMYRDANRSARMADAVTANMVEMANILSDYDADDSGRIEKSEAVMAVLDYLIRNEITKEEAVEVVTAFILQTAV